MVPRGALDLEGVDRFGDGALAGAQFLDASNGGRDKDRKGPQAPLGRLVTVLVTVRGDRGGENH